MRKMLVTAFLFTIKISFASDLFISALNDTTITKNEYKISKKGFLEKYGRDDSSRALINFYFRKRGAGKIVFFFNAPIASFFLYLGLGIALGNSQSNFGLVIAEIVIYDILAGAFMFLAFGAITWIKYARKKLLWQLNAYFSGQSLPKKIAMSKAFKRFLKGPDK